MLVFESGLAESEDILHFHIRLDDHAQSGVHRIDNEQPSSGIKQDRRLIIF